VEAVRENAHLHPDQLTLPPDEETAERAINHR
jgi:hypothetical protein